MLALPPRGSPRGACPSYRPADGSGRRRSDLGPDAGGLQARLAPGRWRASPGRRHVQRLVPWAGPRAFRCRRSRSAGATVPSSAPSQRPEVCPCTTGPRLYLYPCPSDDLNGASSCAFTFDLHLVPSGATFRALRHHTRSRRLLRVIGRALRAPRITAGWEPASHAVFWFSQSQHSASPDRIRSLL